MPIVTRTNNRILPPNARASDVAANTIPALIDIQRAKYHAAFRVQGYPVCIYYRLASGLRCHCQNQTAAVVKRLGSDGHATPGFMNELLTGGAEFGIRSYGQTVPKTPNTIFHFDQDANATLYDDDVHYQNESIGTAREHYSNDPNSGATLLTEEGRGGRGPFSQQIDDAEDDAHVSSDLFGVTDIACPVCFGSGYVGGFSILNGTRAVLNYQHPGLVLPAEASVSVEERVPVIAASAADFTVTLPRGAAFVDAFRVWNNRSAVPAKLYVDGTLLRASTDVLRYFDGRPHVLRVEAERFTHVELQVGQSTETEYIDFPKVQRSSLAELLDSMDDVQLVASPMVPLLRPNDLVADGVHNKVFHVRSCTGLHDRAASVLGWECDARVVQPQEVLSLLPRRRTSTRVSTPNTPTRLINNVSGPRRT